MPGTSVPPNRIWVSAAVLTILSTLLAPVLAQCQSGQYMTEGDGCTPCPAGKYQDAPNGHDEWDCKDCQAGKFSAVEGSFFCQPCTAGYYQNATSQTGCLSCEFGFYTDAMGSDGCMPCAFPVTAAQASCDADCTPDVTSLFPFGQLATTETTQHGQIVVVDQCAPGYTPQGSATVECQDGVWVNATAWTDIDFKCSDTDMLNTIHTLNASIQSLQQQLQLFIQGELASQQTASLALPSVQTDDANAVVEFPDQPSLWLKSQEAAILFGEEPHAAIFNSAEGLVVHSDNHVQIQSNLTVLDSLVVQGVDVVSALGNLTEAVKALVEQESSD